VGRNWGRTKKKKSQRKEVGAATKKKYWKGIPKKIRS